MLDLLVFATATLATRYICEMHPLISKETGRRDEQTNWRDSPVPARALFFSCLYTSMLLLSMSILEAAPFAWLVLFDRGSVFVWWYRALLWTLCVLLLCVHPFMIGIILGTSLFSYQHPPKNQTERRRKSVFATCLSVVWIAVRISVVSCWKILLRLLPCKRKVTGPVALQRFRRCCTTSVTVVALITLSVFVTFAMLLGSLTLQFKSDPDQRGFVAVNDSSDEGSVETFLKRGPLQLMVASVCAFGMIIASLLNGFGSASLPHANLVGLLYKPASPALVAKVEDDLKYATKSLQEKQMILDDILRNPRSLSSSLEDQRQQTISQLREECNFLSSLAADLKFDVQEMKHSQQLALSARMGRRIRYGRVVTGVAFSVILVVRVVFAARSFVGTRDAMMPTSDPLTSVALFLIRKNFVTQEFYERVRQGISLILAAVLSLSQIRAFFRIINIVGRKANKAFGMCSSASSCKERTGNASRGLLLTVSSFIMGCYFMSCVTVVKMFLPIEYRSSFSAAVGLHFDFNTIFLQQMYVGAAIATAIILCALTGIQKSRSDCYQLDGQLSLTQFA